MKRLQQDNEEFAVSITGPYPSEACPMRASLRCGYGWWILIAWMRHSYRERSEVCPTDRVSE